MESNMGASLDASWFTGHEPNDEKEEKGRVWYSSNPLAAGLLDSVKKNVTNAET